MDEQMMRLALELAAEAGAEGEVPVGAVVTLGDRIVGRGRNRRESDRNALRHAELEAIDEACKCLGGWRLWQCTLYVTLEPCPMCAGAMVMSQLDRVVFGAADPVRGCCGSVYDLPGDPALQGRTVWKAGVLEEECKAALTGFFEELRGE